MPSGRRASIGMQPEGVVETPQHGNLAQAGLAGDRARGDGQQRPASAPQRTDQGDVDPSLTERLVQRGVMPPSVIKINRHAPLHRVAGLAAAIGVPAGTNLLFFCRSERACSSSSVGMGLAVEPHAVANHRQQLGFIEKVEGRSRQRCRRHASRAAELGSRVERHGQQPIHAGFVLDARYRLGAPVSHHWLHGAARSLISQPTEMQASIGLAPPPAALPQPEWQPVTRQGVRPSGLDA